MQTRTLEISVGAFVLAGALALVFLAVKVSGVDLLAQRDSYLVDARFNDVAGLRERSKVSLAGVTVGRVVGIRADMDYGEAIVTLELYGQPGSLPVDTGARIVTEGMLGARYISLSPGIDEDYLVDGDLITDTQGAMVLEQIIGDFVTRMGAK
jgi:phospholipid/cholesterol/gamma-HCH transport system substrate-binding protein